MHVSTISASQRTRQSYRRRVRDEARPDLAAIMAPLMRALVAAERPVLRAHHVSTWGYAVLLGLDSGPVRSQQLLADSIGADKSRLVAVLDDLQAHGLITREPDPEDRRVRLIAITARGIRVRHTVQRAIQRNERRLLAELEPACRADLLRGLRRLAQVAPGWAADVRGSRPGDAAYGHPVAGGGRRRHSDPCH